MSLPSGFLAEHGQQLLPSKKETKDGFHPPLQSGDEVGTRKSGKRPHQQSS